MGIPVLNFGFYGNGRLQPEIIDYMAHLDARAYVLASLANFTLGNRLDADDALERLLQWVRTIRKFRPQAPIILTDHAGYSGGETYKPLKNQYETLNAANYEAFEKLKTQGVKHIYLITFKDLGLFSQDFVDGTHPTDGGIEKYPLAFEKVLFKILKKDSRLI